MSAAPSTCSTRCARVRRRIPVIFASTNKVYGDLGDLQFGRDATTAMSPWPNGAGVESMKVARSISTRLTAAQRQRPTNIFSITAAASASRPSSSA